MRTTRKRILAIVLALSGMWLIALLGETGHAAGETLLTGRIATTPCTFAFENHSRALSALRISSFGAIRYAATVFRRRAVSSRTSASSPATRNESS